MKYLLFNKSSISSCGLPNVSYITLELSLTLFYRVWLRPGQEVMVKVTLMDASGRELLDENGPKMSWDIEPGHPGLHYKAVDRIFVEHHPEYLPVPVPYKYYQVSR